jgi:hypothetical protein
VNLLFSLNKLQVTENKIVILPLSLSFFLEFWKLKYQTSKYLNVKPRKYLGFHFNQHDLPDKIRRLTIVVHIIDKLRHFE